MRRALVILCMGLVIAGGLSGCRRWRNLIGKNPQTVLKPAPAPKITEAQEEKLVEAQTAKYSGDYDSALTLFHQILAVNPTITTAYLGIGEIHLIRKQYTLAEPAYRRAARLEPRNFDAQYGHGLALQLLERFADAIRAYQRALTILPSSFDANLNLGTTYLQMDQPYRALRYSEMSVQLNAANGAAHVNLGAVYEKLNRNEEAITQYLEAAELMEPTPPLLMNLINVLAKERKYHQAANTAENLTRIAPSANAYERLGWAYFRLAEYDKSVIAYRRGVELNAKHYPSLNGVGVNALNTWLLSKKRDVEARTEARWAFRESLRVNPRQQKIINLMSQYGF